MNLAATAFRQPCRENQVERTLAELDDCPEIAFCTGHSSISWADWASMVSTLKYEFQRLSGCAVGLRFPPRPRSYATLCALSCLNCDVFLLDEGADPGVVKAVCDDHHLRVLIDPGSDEQVIDQDAFPQRDFVLSNSAGSINIFTSGSTGLPKPVSHNWETLTRPVRVCNSTGNQRWLLTYRPQLYAGLQVFFHCLLNRGTLVIPDVGMAVKDLIALMGQWKVSHVSATPSHWRRLISLGSSRELQALGVKQITLGGEACDQAVLDGLKRVFPMARIVHIYATSELGRCFSVKDGLAGFPADFLIGLTEEGIELKVEDGELLVRSTNGMLGAGPGGAHQATESGPWVATGDMIEQVGDRCFFAGRRNELINVGGNKVNPLRVEQVVQTVPGVTDLRVFARTSSLVGQMVACEVVVAPDHDAAVVRQEIARTCLERLAPHERPRFVEAVSEIRLSEAGKKIRRSS